MSLPSVATGGAPLAIASEPSGRYLYVLSQGGGGVFQFTIGADGALSPMVPPCVPTADLSPLSLTVDPLGQYLYVANQNSDSISQYQIALDGRLTPLAPPQIASFPNPWAVAIARGAAACLPPIPWPDPN
jgi:6-phosphogluconolactonase (cycloisomerase 2 family)